MRTEDSHARLDPTQAAAADAGVKGMIMIDRPFLDYSLSALADAGLKRAVLVIGPEHVIVREYFQQHPPARITLDFAVQPEPLGTANAVLAAASVIGEETFLVLNADNFYPASALRALAAQDAAGVVAFERDGLIAGGGIEPERIRQFAILDIGPDDRLLGIVEKPGVDLDLSSEAARWVSMNLWALTPVLVDACRRVTRSARGEFELPEAIAIALAEGLAVRVERSHAAVLDLSHRRDIASVTERLRGSSVTP